MKHLFRRVCLAALGCSLLVGMARAEDEIRVGVIYPLTGAAAGTGVELKAAAELAAAIVNKEIALPGNLAAGSGLPNLKGAKLKLIFGDHRCRPQQFKVEFHPDCRGQ